jgi:hypothetical protein
MVSFSFMNSRPVEKSPLERKSPGSRDALSIHLSFAPATPKELERILYDSVLTLALPLVTLTPSCFALVTMSMRFLAETEWEILSQC